MWRKGFRMKAAMVILSMIILGCGAMIPNSPVSMVGQDGTQYSGEIDYDDGYTGTLTIQSGPNGESFSGRFVVVDHTSTSMQGGGFLAQDNGMIIPSAGLLTGSSSGQVIATGHWHGIGSAGTQLTGEMVVGREGHGHGNCYDGHGNTYKIMF
jgi:hypothetical protein